MLARFDEVSSANMIGSDCSFELVISNCRVCVEHPPSTTPGKFDSVRSGDYIFWSWERQPVYTRAFPVRSKRSLITGRKVAMDNYIGIMTGGGDCPGLN